MDVEEIIRIGRLAPPFPADQRTDENEVVGCSVQSWIAKVDGRLYVTSNSLVVQGILAVVAYHPELVDRTIDLLTVNRRAGLASARARVEALRNE